MIKKTGMGIRGASRPTGSSGAKAETSRGGRTRSWENTMLYPGLVKTIGKPNRKMVVEWNFSWENTIYLEENHRKMVVEWDLMGFNSYVSLPEII